MQVNEKHKKIILIVLGIVIVLLILLFAIKGCSKKEYEITFDTNGGGNISTTKVQKDGKIVKPADPTKDGYIFDGWYYNDELFDFNTKITDDMILEAKWIKAEAVMGISLDLKELSLKPNSSHTLVVTITPENAQNKKVLWSSSDDDIVTVDENGKLKALKNGKATITVTTEDGKYKATCEVTVTSDIVSVTSVTIKGASEVLVGKTIKLTADIKPNDASDKSVKQKSSDSKIASVDKNGNVKGLKNGKVTITVTTNDGNKTAKKDITIKENSNPNPIPSNPNSGESSNPTPTTPSEVKVTGVSLNKDKLTLNVNDSDNLKATITPSNATNKGLKWQSSNPNVVKVDDNGKVTALSEGTATITVTTVDGNYEANCDVVVSSIYKIELKTQFNDNQLPVGYNVIVYKDGKKFTDYKNVIYKGLEKYDYFLSSEIQKVEKNITLTLKDGKTINLQFTIVNQKGSKE